VSDTQDRAAVTDLAAAIQVLADVSDLDGSQLGGVLLVTDLPEDNFELTQLRPTQAAVPALLSIGLSALGFYLDCEVIDYGPATTCVGKEVMWKPLSEVPLLESVVNDSADLANISLFDPKKTKLSNTRLTAIRFESDRPVVFVQAMAGSQVVARSKKFGVLVKKGVIDVPKGDLLLLNQSVTAIITGGLIFFANRLAFQKLFNLLKELQERAEATFREVADGLRIDGFDQMVIAVTTQSQMVGKMASIQSKIDKYPKYKDALTMPKLLAFVRSHPECQVELSGAGDDAKLIFQPDPQHRFKILKLLDDDYLRSELTTLGYETNSKGAPISGG
jgi:Domain of unknown function (DUF4868)